MTNPPTSHLKRLYACKTTLNYIHLPPILSPLPSLRRQTHEIHLFTAIYKEENRSSAIRKHQERN